MFPRNFTTADLRLSSTKLNLRYQMSKSNTINKINTINSISYNIKYNFTSRASEPFFYSYRSEYDDEIGECDLIMPVRTVSV